MALVMVLSVAGMLAACGSSGGGSASPSGTPTDVTSSIDAVSVDISNLDASQQASAGASISVDKSLGATAHKGIGKDEGDDSRSGCELNSLKKDVGRIGKQADAVLCYMGTVQAQIPAFVVDSTQRYYSITVPAMKGEENEGSFSMLMRIQKSDGTLMFDMCNGSTPTLSEEFTFSQSGLSTSVVGYHHFAGENSGPGSGFEDSAGFSLTAVLKDTATGDMDYTNLDSGSLIGKFDGHYGSAEITFGKLAGQDVNTISGVFLGQFGPSNDSFTAQIVGKTGATTGAAQHAVTGSFPPIPNTVLPASMRSLAPDGFCPMSEGFEDCDPATNFSPGGSCQGQSPSLSCFCMQAPVDGTCAFTDSGTESFSIATDAETMQQTFTKTAANEYHAEVAAMALPSTDLTSPTATRNWDCDTTGQTVVAIDASAVDFTVCDTKMGKGLDDSEHNSCHEQETNGKAESGSGEFEED